jgi:predicted transcriptional regulator
VAAVLHDRATPRERLHLATLWYHDVMTQKQTTVRLPEELADQAEAVARVRGTSVNAVIVDALTAEIERVRDDDDFTSRAKRLLERDKELLERLAR